MRYYIDAFRNYNNKNGRATRKEYLFFILFNIIFTFCFSFIDAILDTYPTLASEYKEYSMEYGYFTIAYILISACPVICLQIRRLHDVGKSGNWWFLGNIPILNFYLVYLYLKASDPNINKYGAPVNIKRKYFTITKEDRTEQVDNEIIYNKMCSVVTENKMIDIEPQKSKARFCKFCGTQIDIETKKCNGCGKQYFKGIKFTKFSITVSVLSLMIISSIILNVVQIVEMNELMEDKKFYQQKSEDKLTQIYKLNKEIKDKDDDLDFYHKYAVIVSDSSKKYHLHGCSDLGDSSFMIYNVSQAKNLGYSECSKCYPRKLTLDEINKKYGIGQ